MLTLYHFNNSVCSEKVRMALNEKNLEWQSCEVDLFKGAQFDPDYLKINPKGVVPTLIDDDRVQTESTLIAEYLDDAYPEPALKPADAYERAQMRLFSKACDEGLHQGVAVLSYAAVFMDRLRAKPRDELEAHLSRIPDLDRRDRQMSIYEHGTDAPHIYRGVVAYEKIFQKIEKTLADGRDWLAGGRFSLAEINLAPYFARLEYLNLLDAWIGERPATTAWFERVKARPSFTAEVVDRIEPGEWAEMQSGGAIIKASISEKRSHYLANDAAAALA